MSMDLMPKIGTDLNVNIKKRKVFDKQVLRSKDIINTKHIRCLTEEDDDSDQEVIDKWLPIDYESDIKKSSEKTCLPTKSSDKSALEDCLNNNSDHQKPYSKTSSLIDDLLHLFAAKLHLNFDFIHERYRQYLQQPQSQRDLTKTDYTYAWSYSYNSRIDRSKLFDWLVPNMSRKSITTSSSVSKTSSKSSTVTKLENINNSINSSHSIATDRLDRESSVSLDASRRSPKEQMFTRSNCLGGNQCEAGCEIHKKSRKRGAKTAAGILIPNSGQGLEPQIEFSDDDETYAMHNRLNQQILHQSMGYERNNGYRITGNNVRNRRRVYEADDDDEDTDEEVTVVRRVTNIFKTTINNTSKLIDSMTPPVVKRVTNKCPTICLLLILLPLLSGFVYLISQYASSPSSLWVSPYSPLDGLSGTSDMSAKHAINELIKEMKTIRYDLQSLKDSNNDFKSHMKSSDNEKWTKFDERVATVEDHLNNYMTNCCRNDTDAMLALIDHRLSEFMTSMLAEQQSGVRPVMTASEAAEELKQFIGRELSKTNGVFIETVEHKLMSTVERLESQINNAMTSNDNTAKNDQSSNITIAEIKSLISQALAIYDADKTGQPDFALEPAGGTIVNTRCSETFDPHGVQYKVFGIPFWSSSVSPRAVIQPTISPGECWAFKGSNGYLVIKLSQAIRPTGFSYEHIPKQISRDGNIDSAPKEFQVRALDDSSDQTGRLLGNYVYEDNDQPMQYFQVEDPNPRPVEYVELVMLSNHGHTDYTCLYRFRVHGQRINT